MQLSYTVNVYNEKGAKVASRMGTRPEVDSVTVDTLKDDSYRIELTVTDVFGQNVSESFETAAFEEKDDSQGGENEGSNSIDGQNPPDGSALTPPTDEQKPLEPTQNETEKEPSKIGIWLPVTLGVIGGVLVTLTIIFIVLKKRNRNH